MSLLRPSLLLALLLVLLVAPAASAASDPLRPQQWALDQIEGDAARASASGSGALVAVIDTGARLNHPDLGGRLVPGRDFVQNDDVPQDGNGHGTHVSGTIVANADNGVGIAGVAPGARVLVVRVLDDSGTGNDSTVAAGIRYAVQRGANIINLSLGEDLPVSLLLGSDSGDATREAVDRGVIVAAAAGNNGLPLCSQADATSGRLLCVGSVDRAGQLSSFSNFGRGVNILGPGGEGCGDDSDPDGDPSCDVLSTWKGAPDYKAIAGTSMATPHVAGVAALLYGCGLRGQAIIDRIRATARTGPDTPDPGILDARAAVSGLCGSSAGGGTSGCRGCPSPESRSAAAARVIVPRSIRRSDLLRRGVSVRCTPARDGRCAARLRVGRRTVGRGTASARAGQRVIVRVKVSRRGRSLARRARALRVRVAVPGAGALTRLTRVRSR